MIRWGEVLEQVVLLHQHFSHNDRIWVKYAKFRHIIRPRYIYTKNYSISNVLIIMQGQMYMVWKWETPWDMGINASDRHGLNIKMLVGSIVRNWNTRFLIFNNRTTTIRTPAPHTLSSAQSQKCALEYMFKQLFYASNSYYISRINTASQVSISFYRELLPCGLVPLCLITSYYYRAN